MMYEDLPIKTGDFPMISPPESSKVAGRELVEMGNWVFGCVGLVESPCSGGCHNKRE